MIAELLRLRSEVASGVAGERVGTATSSVGEVRGVSSSGSLPALGEAIGLPRSGASSSVDSYRAEVGSREFGSLKQSVPNFNEKFRRSSIVEEALRGCLLYGWVHVGVPRRSCHDMMIGDVTKNTQDFLPHGSSEEHTKTARVAWAS